MESALPIRAWRTHPSRPWLGLRNVFYIHTFKQQPHQLGNWSSKSRESAEQFRAFESEYQDVPSPRNPVEMFCWDMLGLLVCCQDLRLFGMKANLVKGHRSWPKPWPLSVPRQMLNLDQSTRFNKSTDKHASAQSWKSCGAGCVIEA